MDIISVIQNVCNSISSGNTDKAKTLILENYKHNFIKYDKRAMSHYEKLKIFLDDGFIDRYTGKKLLFPNVLRILSIKLGNIFPFQQNWKMADCHIAYWEYYPTYDHIIPIARGGKDISENIVTTSMIMNSAKSNFLLEEIGFKLYEKGDLKNWNGMILWYLNYLKNNKDILQDKYIKKWHIALLKWLDKFKLE
jgi:hypothetical protein